MKVRQKTTLISVLFLTLLGCASSRTWTVQETKEWYQKYYVEQPMQSRPFVSPVCYEGSTDKYHYFVCRFMDEWVFIKIEIDSLQLEEVKPKWESSHKNDSTGCYIGYYPVDPLNDFKRIEKE